MKKEYRGKFGNFVHEERKKEEETLEICEDILKNSRNEMAVAMRFLQSAFGALRPTVSGETDVMGTDGKLLFASPTWLLNTFIQNKVWINRMYLHELLHCLFCHLWNRKVKEESDQRLWNLAADIAVESGLYPTEQFPKRKVPPVEGKKERSYSRCDVLSVDGMRRKRDYPIGAGIQA